MGLGTCQVLNVHGHEGGSRHEMVRAAFEAGANIFDSSAMYGEAERILDHALNRHSRDRATVVTKVWTSNDREAERQIERSLILAGGISGSHERDAQRPGGLRAGCLQRCRDLRN